MKLAKVKDLKLDKNCELLPQETEKADYLVKFKYELGKVSQLYFFDEDINLICKISAKEVDRISLKSLSNRDVNLLEKNLAESDRGSKSFKENLVTLFLYKRFFAHYTK